MSCTSIGTAREHLLPITIEPRQSMVHDASSRATSTLPVQPFELESGLSSNANYSQDQISSETPSGDRTAPIELGSVCFSFFKPTHHSFDWTRRFSFTHS